MVKIGFTGTRDEITEWQRSALKDYLAGIKDPIESAHHGDCVGADTEFHNACEELGIDIVIHPPEKKDLRAFNTSDIILEEKSYFARNRNIVDECDVLLACSKTDFETQGGTWYTINYAIRKKKMIVIFYPERMGIKVDHLID